MLTAESSILIQLAFIIWEVTLHWGNGKLLLESVDLVQEEDDRGLDEPSGVTDGVEEGEGLLHAVDGFVFEE